MYSHSSNGGKAYVDSVHYKLLIFPYIYIPQMNWLFCVHKCRMHFLNRKGGST